MSDEDWMKAAVTDDSVVAELLMRLHRAVPSKRDHSPALPLEWSVRQRRSRPMTLQPKKMKKPTRASPTTPLSWSGGGDASVSAAADGFEESSRPAPPKQPESARSKANTASGTATNKRSRKKKSLVELKDEEILLLKERRHLKRELTTLRVTLEKQRAKNESLKRLKLDMESRTSVAVVPAVACAAAVPNQPQQKLVSFESIPPVLQPDVRIDDHDAARQLSLTSSKMQQVVISQDHDFVLPDLNLPVENSNSEVLDGIS